MIDHCPQPSALDDYQFDLNGFLVEPVPPVLPGEARIPYEARHNGG